MSTYGSAASVFQLAFGLNAALPTLYFVYRKTQDSLARRLAEKMANIDPSFVAGERELIVVRHFVRYGFPGMGLSRRLGIAVAVLFAIVLVLSFLGLLLSAIKSDCPINEQSVIWFSIFALIVCPLAGICYERWLGYFEEQVVLRLDRDAVIMFLEPVKQTLAGDRLGDEMKKLTIEAKELYLKMEEEELKREWREIRERLRQRIEQLRRMCRWKWNV